MMNEPVFLTSLAGRTEHFLLFGQKDSQLDSFLYEYGQTARRGHSFLTRWLFVLFRTYYTMVLI